jgi:hypothetical protein
VGGHFRAAGSLFYEMGVRAGGTLGISATWLFPGFFWDDLFVLFWPFISMLARIFSPRLE